MSNPDTTIGPSASQPEAAAGVVRAQDNWILKTGDTMCGDLNMGGRLVRGLPVTEPSAYKGDEATSWLQTVRLVRDAANTLLPVSGTGAMGGPLQMGGNPVRGVADPIDSQDAATKKYVDTRGAAMEAHIDGESTHRFSAQEVPVLLMLGQSNTDGRGVLADVPGLNTAFGGEVKIWSKAVIRSPPARDTNRVNNGVWKNYAIGDMVVSPSGTNPFGPELQIAKRWRDEVYPLHGTSLYIIKLAVGGTSLAAASGADTSWHLADSSLRGLALDYFITPALLELRLAGLQPRCIGMIWGQGESDATPQSAPAYAANLDSFLTDMRNRSGFPDMKILIMGLSNYPGGADWDCVKRAQAAQAGATYISTDGVGPCAPIDRFISSLGAKNLHYSSSGLLTLGNLYFDELDLQGCKFVDPWDFSFAVGALDGHATPNPAFTQYSAYGSLSGVRYPTAASSISAFTFVRTGETPERPAFNTSPSPSITINALANSSDVEVVVRMVHDGDRDTKPGFVLRSQNEPNPTKGVLVQCRSGGGQLTMFENQNGSWIAMAGSPVTPTQSPTAGHPYWYRVVLIGSRLEVYTSPNGRIWTEQYRGRTLLTSSTTPGNVWFTLYNGLCDRAVGNIRVAHCAFDVMRARRLL